MSGPLKLYFANLPNDMDEDSLREYFKGYGDIVNVQVSRKDGTNPDGRAWITYEKSEDALRCVEDLNGALFEEKVLTVKVDNNQNHYNNSLANKMKARAKKAINKSLKVNPQITKTSEIKQYEKLLEELRTTIKDLSEQSKFAGLAN